MSAGGSSTSTAATRRPGCSSSTAIGRLELGSATEADASLVKLQCSEAAVESNLDAFRIHGAKGFETAGSEGLLDALSSVTYSGTSDLQKVIIAASLGLQP